MDVHGNVELLCSLCFDISAAPLSEALSFILLYCSRGGWPSNYCAESHSE